MKISIIIPCYNEEKTIKESLEEALAEVKQALSSLDAVYAAYAEPDADFDKLAKEQAKLEAICNRLVSPMHKPLSESSHCCQDWSD